MPNRSSALILDAVAIARPCDWMAHSGQARIQKLGHSTAANRVAIPSLQLTLSNLDIFGVFTCSEMHKGYTEGLGEMAQLSING
jgi:hypothetical protein